MRFGSEQTPSANGQVGVANVILSPCPSRSNRSSNSTCSKTRVFSRGRKGSAAGSALSRSVRYPTSRTGSQAERLVLSTMFAVKGDVERQREFCRRVMLAGAAALFVKTTRFVENMPRRYHRPRRQAQVPHRGGAARPPLDSADAGRHRGHHRSAGLATREIPGDPPESSRGGHTWRRLAGVGQRNRLDCSTCRWPSSTSHWSCSRQPLPTRAFSTLKLRSGSPTSGTSSGHWGEAGRLFHLQEPDVPSMFVLPIVAGHKSQGYMCALSGQAEPHAHGDHGDGALCHHRHTGDGAGPGAIRDRGAPEGRLPRRPHQREQRLVGFAAQTWRFSRLRSDPGSHCDPSGRGRVRGTGPAAGAGARGTRPPGWRGCSPAARAT